MSADKSYNSLHKKLSEQGIEIPRAKPPQQLQEAGKVIHYKGGGGPKPSAVLHNNKVLQQMVHQNLGVKLNLIPDPYDEQSTVLLIKHPNVTASYDRWGYTIDGDPDLMVDQDSLINTVARIKELLADEVDEGVWSQDPKRQASAIAEKLQKQLEGLVQPDDVMEIIQQVHGLNTEENFEERMEHLAAFMEAYKKFVQPFAAVMSEIPQSKTEEAGPAGTIDGPTMECDLSKQSTQALKGMLNWSSPVASSKMNKVDKGAVRAELERRGELK